MFATVNPANNWTDNGDCMSVRPSFGMSNAGIAVVGEIDDDDDLKDGDLFLLFDSIMGGS